jgi:hypothetical protein
MSGRFQIPPAFRKSQQATYRQEKVSADVNQFTDGNAATAVSLDLISGQFRKRLNTARCVLNCVVRELDCRETQTLCSNNRLTRLRPGPTILMQLSDCIEHAP